MTTLSPTPRRSLGEPAPPPTPPPFGFTAPTPERFGGAAPAPTPYGDFTAPDPAAVANDPYYQFRLSQGLKQQQRGAAAKGTLLSGGFQKALMGYGQGLASEEGQNIYNRALSTYGANRDTNAQNFGQQMGAFQGNLGAFNANSAASLGAGRLGLDAATAGYDRTYQAGRDQQDYQQRLNDAAAVQPYGPEAAADMAQQNNAEMQRFAAANRMPVAPMRPLPGQRGPFMPGRMSLGGRR